MQARRLFHQLKSTAGDVVSIDPTSSSLTASFRFDSIDAKLGALWCYGLKIRIWLQFVLTQAGGTGVAIKPDQLYRALASIKLTMDDIGTLYNPGDLTGPILGLISQVVSAGYNLPFLLRDDVAAANGTTTVTLPIDVPLAHFCFRKGHQTGLWNGFLKRNGQLDVTLAPSTVFAGISPGSSYGTITVRAELVSSAEPEARVPAVWLWRTRTTPAGEVKHTIRNLCQGAGITGVTGTGKVAFLAWLSSNVGLGGASTVDQIQRVYPRDRGQVSHNLGSPFYGTSSFLADFVEETRVQNIFPIAQDQGYPYQLGTPINGAPNAATAYFLPYFWPDVEGQDVSKLQEWSGDYYIEHDYGAVPNAVAEWLSLEQSYLTSDQEQFLMGERMGLSPSQYRAYPKVRGLNHPGDQAGMLQQQAKLRGIPKKIRQVA